MSDPIAHWHAEHVYFRRLLGLLHRELDAFHRGERPNYELMLDIITYLRDYGDRFHHPREDVAFARLADCAPDLRPALARLAQEHRIIARAGEKLAALLEAALGGSFAQRAEVEIAAATYLVYYGNHIAKEDELVLSRAAQALSEADWQAVRAAVADEPDPLFGERPHERYRELRRQIAAAAH